MDPLLHDAYTAQSVAFAIFYGQTLFYQLFEGVAHRGLVQIELLAEGPGGLWLDLVETV